MVARPGNKGTILVEALVALGILVMVMIPMSYSIVREREEFRVDYHRAIAMEMVDGEMEILRAGAWRQCPEGTHPHVVPCAAAANLPPGRFVLTRQQRHLRLQWLPDGKDQGGPVTRECDLP
jgi:hypothetical protein